MNQSRFVLLICIIVGLLISCDETGESSTGALTFKIENLEENLLIIESGADVSIPYTSNVKKPAIAFSVYPDATGLALSSDADRIIARAETTVKGKAYRITANVTSGRRSAQAVFSIYVDDGANLEGGITSILMITENPYEIDSSKPWELEYEITPAAFQYAAAITYSIVPPPPQPAVMI